MLGSNDSGIRQLPDYCNNSPFGIASVLPWCTYSDSELHHMSVNQMQQIAAINPDLANWGIAHADALHAQAESNNNSNPPTTGSDLLQYVVMGMIGLVVLQMVTKR